MITNFKIFENNDMRDKFHVGDTAYYIGDNEYIGKYRAVQLLDINYDSMTCDIRKIYTSNRINYLNLADFVTYDEYIALKKSEKYNL